MNKYYHLFFNKTVFCDKHFFFTKKIILFHKLQPSLQENSIYNNENINRPFDFRSDRTIDLLLENGFFDDKR